MTSCPPRLETIVPTKAPPLLTSTVVFEQPRRFAARLLKECGEQPEPILSRAWLLAFNRPITEAETARALAFLHGRQTAVVEAERLTESRQSPSAIEEALTELCLALFNANEFTYLD